MFSTSELRDIASRASTLDERLDGRCVPCGALDEDREARDRLTRWQEAAANGNADAFARRLRQAGHDQASVLPLLGRVRLTDNQPLPRWVREFAGIAAAMRQPSAPRANGKHEPGGPIAFNELLRPAVGPSWHQLSLGLDPEILGVFGPTARRALKQNLLRQLSDSCAGALFGDFSLYRHVERQLGSGVTVPFWSPESRELYNGYIATWRGGRGRRFFLAKPVAARLLGTTLAHWLDATTEMAERLHRDMPQLQQSFAGGKELGRVISVETGLSDPHRRGRAVAILGFASGVKIVYKPKDMAVDCAFADLLGWFDARGLPVPVAAPQSLACDGYGWAGFVVADAAGSDKDSTYYRSAGGLLAVLHLLRGSDFHHENIIDSAGRPVPIDLETLLTPELAEGVLHDTGEPAATAAAKTLRNSVLMTLYLPLWVGLPGRRAVQIGGVAQRRQTPVFGRFRYPNSDAMSLVEPMSDVVLSEAVGEPSLLPHQTAAMVSGFAQQYAFLLAQRGALSGSDGPLHRLHELRLRVVLEGTMAYAMVARHAAAYEHLGDGVDWSLHFERLGRKWLAEEPAAHRWRIMTAERQALARLDVPLFTARCDDDMLEACNGDGIAGCLAGTPFQELSARIESLGKADLALQLLLIRNSVAPQRSTYPRVGVSGHGDLVQLARGLGNTLAAHAVRVDGHAAWIGVRPVDHQHGNVMVVDADLYAGTIGIALFLAALARITTEARFRELAIDATGPALHIRSASDGGARMARILGIGAGSGLGSIIYGLVRIADLLQTSQLLAEAEAFVALIDDERIASDQACDVLSGSAGAILALLALHNAGSGPALERSMACGRHVVASRLVERGVNGGQAPLRSGFSHGAAGIALALLRLHAASGVDEFRDMAAELITYERRLFLPARNNWRTLPGDDADTAVVCQWCYGATGIGLARLGCLSLTDDADISHEVAAALDTTKTAMPSPHDHLCCGNFGRVDFLLTAGLRLDRPALVSLARQCALKCIERAVAQGGFRWNTAGDSLNPGLFQGIAGIGYELLRLAEPGVLPSILSWD